ncbi:hypothetical protein [Pseudoalteromonas sp. McH1-42]|uniref:hypothetical protein n=1 Tax=Pseudoalteromonas sp. McH1-42 TaxID=2917752 RepID=UPI001EF6B5AC|nr:hypothetical protein [Pseudoalteromonas sp. McH1-42]MCG7561782.1 hypothetical protein [Pseudoalteromonas sp. McH1-42]
MQRLKAPLKLVCLTMAGTVLAGCSYFWDHDIELKGCFPALEYRISAADEPIYRASFIDSHNSLIAAGYDFYVVNYYMPSSYAGENGESLRQKVIQMSGNYNMNGDMVISVPSWGERYLGGSAIALNFSIVYQGENGVFDAYTMGGKGIALPQGLSAHCKERIADACEGRLCRFLKYLDIEPSRQTFRGQVS